MNPTERTDHTTVCDKQENEASADASATKTVTDRIDQLIAGSAADQERAVSLLCTEPLDAYPLQIQKLLSSSELLQEFKGELILAMIRQKVDHLFTLDRDGVAYQFNPSLLDDPDYMPVIEQTRRLFDDLLDRNSVLGARFAGKLLDQEILEMLPLDFAGYDAKRLAASIIRLVYLQMKDGRGWAEFEQKHYPGGIQPYPLRIEMRGRN